MTTMNSNGEKIKVLVNKCYGGFELSHKTVELYNSRSASKITDIFFVCRTDPLLIEIYHEIGKKEFGCHYSNIEIEYIDRNYEYCYTIEEYDGFERIELLYEKYNLYLIRDITSNTDISDEDKIIKIKNICEDILK